MNFVKLVQSSDLFVKKLASNIEAIRERDEIWNKERNRFMMDDLPKTGLALVTKYCETQEEADMFKKEHPDVHCVVLSMEERDRREKQRYDEDVDRCKRRDASYVAKVVNGGDYKKIEPFIYGLEILVAQNPENLCEFYLFKMCGCVGRVCLEGDIDHVGFFNRCENHLRGYMYITKPLFIGLVKAKMTNEVVTTYHHSFRGGHTEYVCNPDGSHREYYYAR